MYFLAWCPERADGVAEGKVEDVLGRFMGAMEWWAYGFLHIRLNFRLAELFLLEV